MGLIAIAGSSIFGALETRWSQESRERPARERIFAANVIEIQPQTLSPTLRAFGEVRSRRTLELRASASGEVVWLADGFEEGGSVQAGELVARIDPSDAQGNLDVASADLAEAEADLRDAKRFLALAEDEVKSAEEQAALRARALVRQEDLLERGVGTEASVETASLAASSARQSVLSRRQALAQSQSSLDQATTTVERRKIALSEAERRLSETEIHAQFSGVLSGVNVVDGRLVANNERLAEIIDPDALEVSFRISTSQYSRLLDDTGKLPKSDVTVSLDVLGVDLTAKGRISRESAGVSDGQTGRLLFARLDDAPGFRPGDFVTVEVAEPMLANVALIPSQAVDSQGTVLVLGGDDRLEIATVEVLRRQQNEVIIRARDIAGREIVDARTPLLGAGIKVRPIRPDGADVPTAPEMLELDAERRAKLVAFVEGNKNMPPAAKERVLAQLSKDKVPARVVERIESRMGG
jgi:multidrug efflux pump subunit AcrA (membrane-fusion protein)